MDTTLQEDALFDAARKLPDPARRQAFLNEACAGDPARKARIESLLESEAEAEQFFRGVSLYGLAPGEGPGEPPSRTGTSPAGPASAESAPTEGPGTRIGRYKLLQRIGEGGCGVVYMAEQEEPVRRRVALKIIKLGMDTKSVIARFEAERQALAMMDHSSIARVLDAGATDTGRPYFVMELVRGVKITDYCDQNNLDTSQRLDLFIQICHAIQHAHQKGIIHRDIKPSNILVTLHDGVPVPKVIDFGIAKATEGRLTDRTLFTAYEQFIGTPAYMSPEQAEMSGLDIDTRSDIYSLGVLLYELLTSRTPFDGKKLLQHGLDEMRRTLREREPQRPSTMVTTLHGEELTATAAHRQAEPFKLISILRGDLDWIVMKALEKDRRRRYETANGLAMDIERHLNNEPVIARPPSRLYRLQKLVHRNRGVFAAVGAVTAALVIGLGASTWLFFRERAARQRAVDAEQQQARLRVEAERARANEAELRRQAETREKTLQAVFYLNQERFEEADELISGVVWTKSTLDGAAVLRSVGEWRALRGNWRRAAKHFGTLLQVNQLDYWDTSSLDHLECGATLVELGDLDGYDRFRQEAVARFTDTTNAVSAERILKISLLLPADQGLMRALEPLANVASNTFAGTPISVGDEAFRAAWAAVSLALMEYRLGRYVEATEWSRHCLAFPEYNAPRTATARVILALALHQLGREAESRSELDRGRELIESKLAGGLDRGSAAQGFWFDWVLGKILLREAASQIEGRERKSPAP